MILTSKCYKLLPKPKDNQIAPYHGNIAADLKETLGLDEPTTTAVVAALQVPEHRFLEKAAAFQFRKLWPANRDDAQSLAIKVGEQARALALGDRDGGADLDKRISHFSSDILAQLFNDYADRFDEALVEKLNYTVPAKLAALISNHVGPGHKFFDAVDRRTMVFGQNVGQMGDPAGLAKGIRS